jgi:hypothetical protein
VAASTVSYAVDVAPAGREVVEIWSGAMVAAMVMLKLAVAERAGELESLTFAVK